MARSARLTGWGKYLPERVLANDELERLVDTTDAWIWSRTGIKERRIASSSETASSMAVGASRDALGISGLDSAEIDLVVAATCTSDFIFPACAAFVQDAIGALHAAAFDVNAACSGFIYALATASHFIASGQYQSALVVGTEVYSRILDWNDRNTCVLFGDGAGAVVLQACEAPGGFLGFTLGNDGAGTGMLYTPGPCGVNDGRYYLQMNGREVYRFAVNIICQATREALEKAGLDISDVEMLVPHQANSRILKSAGRALGLPPERVFINVDRYGNTSAASIPIALCEVAEEGRLHKGDHVVLVGFGGGLSWASAVMEWS